MILYKLYLLFFPADYGVLWLCLTITTMAKMLFVFLLMVVVSMSVPRIKMEALSKMGWVSIMGAILLGMASFCLGYYLF